MGLSLVGAPEDTNFENEEVKGATKSKVAFSSGSKTKTNEEIIALIWTNDQLNDHARNDLFKLW